MITSSYDPLYITDTASEQDRGKKEYYVSNAVYNIFNLYRENKSLHKAYDYYNLHRDPRALAHLQDNAGIGTPFDIKFEGFIRTRLQALIGTFIERPFTYKVTCTNLDSIEIVNEERKIETLSKAIEGINKVNKELLAKQQQLKQAQQESSEFNVDVSSIVERITKDIENYINTDWQSSFEIAANYLLEYFKGKEIKFEFKKLLEHLIISGSCHYRITIPEVGRDPLIEIIDSRDLFYIKNAERPFIKDCNRIIRRQYKTRQQVLNEYGHLLEPNELEWVKTGFGFFGTVDNVGSVYNSNWIDPFWEYGSEPSTRSYGHGDFNGSSNDILEVFHCEWIASEEVEIDDEEMINNLEIPSHDKSKPKKIKRYVSNRYECTRIGRWIYTKYGKCENVLRSLENPSKCYLSYNGIGLDDFDNPFSLVLATADLQDQYDLIRWKRDLQIYNSGIIADKTVLEAIPKHYGNTPEERMIKHFEWKKQGIDVISISQEGGDFNNYGAKGGMVLEMQQIQGLNLVLDYYKKSASEIIGVPDQMLGIIQEREAVGNVQMSSIKSTVVTLPIYYTHGVIVKELLTDLLNYAKFTYVEGKKGSYLLGNRQQIFTIEPDALMADFGLFVDIGTDTNQDLKLIKDTAIEFVKSQMIEAQTWTKLVGAKSVSEAEQIVNQAFKDAKDNQVTQLSQQLQEAQKQIEQMSAEMKKLDAERQAIDKKRLELEEMRTKADIDYNNRTLNQNKEEFDKEIKLKEKQIQAEVLQLYDDTTLGGGSKSNNEIKNIV